MAEAKSGQIVNVMKEERLFPPPKEFAAKAHVKSLEQYEKLWKEAAGDIEGFWGKLGHELHWFKPYTKVLESGRALRQVVRWRSDQRLVQLPRRPPEHAAPQQGRHYFRGGAGRRPRLYLPKCCTTKSASSPTC